MTTFRVYGPSGENDSLSRVASGLVSGLRSNGRPTAFFDLASLLDEDEGLTEGYDADVGIFVGPPVYLPTIESRGQHRERLVFLFPNSTWLPAEVMADAARHCTGILTATAWGVSVVREHSLGLPVLCCRLGVGHKFTPSEDRQTRKRGGGEGWRALHLSSSRLGRKSTDKLIRAWCLCQSTGAVEQGASLDLVLSGDEDGARRLIEQASDEYDVASRITLMPRLNLGEAEMAALYDRYDLVCQPSRAEGFGLCPLEARACGVPVCATACTGHGEHMHQGLPGVVVVPSGPYAPSDDGPGATAPSVAEQDIAEALATCYEHRQSLGYWAWSGSVEIACRWSWSAVVQDFLEKELGA